MNMTTSDNGLEFIKQQEGVKLVAYKDSVGVPTIGVGHIKGVVMGHTITMQQAMEFLKSDVKTAELAVNNFVKVKLTQNQFDALVSFTFNLGAGSLSQSTLLKKLNSGDYQGAADQFKVWNHAGGKVVNGLTARRLAEAKMFLS